MPSSRYIDGVYNYCDRWCERCPLTARCRVFAMEEQWDKVGEEGINAAFWKSLGLEMPDEFDEFEGDTDDEFVAYDPEPDDEANAVDSATVRFERHQHPLAAIGMEYGTTSRIWLQEHGERVARLPAVEAGRISPAEAIDVLRWYGLQIGVKLNRALSERHYFVDDDDDAWDTGSGWQDDPDDDDLEEIAAEVQRMDRDGSAKVALIGIERSLGAWTVLRNAVPEQDVAIRDFQRRLARLRRAIDEIVPGARTFVRPGFDDGTISDDADIRNP